MEQVKGALSATTSHGLPRLVTNKPVYIRVIWLLLFLFMMSLFLKGFAEFVVKLQARQVTSSLEVKSEPFQFPDVYVCFENAVSGSYSSNIDAKSAKLINEYLRNASNTLMAFLALKNMSIAEMQQREKFLSFLYPQSIPYNLLADNLGHRAEQGIISSGIVFMDSGGFPDYSVIEPTSFYHPSHLLCLKWWLNSTMQSKISKSSTSTGLVVTLLVDTNSTEVASGGAKLLPLVYTGGQTPLPVSDWTMLPNDFFGPDRTSGVRVYLTPSGEYPSDFVSSFSLCPGMHHKIEISMTQQVYKEGQFNCRSDIPDVQFVNPYDQTPYNHSYSYSYCYYYEYHKQFQAHLNLSGDVNPLPWPLAGKKYIFNVTGQPNYLTAIGDVSLDYSPIENAFAVAQALCDPQRPCVTRDYSVSISSSDWPTQSSLMPLISTSVLPMWTLAKAKNQSVPALDFLVSGNASNMASYVRRNLLKMHFKPRNGMADRVTFSRDYGLSNFISDIGGIMGIYLGMSLLTLCELIELGYDVAKALCIQGQRKAALSDASKSTDVKPNIDTKDVIDLE